MGGKKKKSAAVPTGAQPAPAATVNASNIAFESTGKKQQQRPNNEKSASKESKPKGQTSFKHFTYQNRTKFHGNESHSLLKRLEILYHSLKTVINKTQRKHNVMLTRSVAHAHLYMYR